jgi:hypothetical protein
VLVDMLHRQPDFEILYGFYSKTVWVYLTLCSTFCRLCATSVNNLMPSSLSCDNMFQSNLPSSGVQVVMMEASAAHYSAVLLFLCNCLELIPGYVT